MSAKNQIGKIPWSAKEIISSINKFLKIYNNKPIKENTYGMKAPHLFATWFMAKN